MIAGAVESTQSSLHYSAGFPLNMVRLSTWINNVIIECVFFILFFILFPSLLGNPSVLPLQHPPPHKHTRVRERTIDMIVARVFHRRVVEDNRNM